MQTVSSSNLSAGVETPSLTADCLHDNASGLSKYQRYRERHKERLKQERLQRYWADPEAARKKVRDYAKKNPERTKLIHRQTRARRKLKNPNLDQEHYQRHRAKKQAASRAARRANPDKVSASYHKWLANNKGDTNEDRKT